MANFLTAVAIAMTMAGEPIEVQPVPQLELLGTYRITEYCKSCNTPVNSTVTASGRYVEGYSVASSDLSLGTIVVIQGKKRRVDDTGCPNGTIDLLIASNGACECDRLENLEVYRN